MSIRFYLALVYSLVSLTGSAQNLVPNPSFEDGVGCPDYISELHYATPWHSASQGTPDYLSACSTDMFAGVPSNQFGNQLAHSGNAYAGFYVFYDDVTAPPPVPDYREYVQAQLTQPLVKGKHYRVEFYVSLSDYSKYGTDAVAALFTTNPVSRNDDQVIGNVSPQVAQTSGTKIVDKSGWTKISGCFQADSAYNYVTIGAFKSGNDVQFQYVGSQYLIQFCYYFLDDVSVTEVPVPTLDDSVDACTGDAITLDAKAGANSYLWNTGATTQTIVVNATGLYNVQRNMQGCLINDTVDVAIHQGVLFSLGNDTSVRFCDSPPLTVGIEGNNNATYQWSNGSQASQISITAPATYALTVTDEYGCTTSDAITLQDDCPNYLYVPNAFSPNGDGHNELFLCIAEGLTSFDLKVYNRWGQVVFRTNDYTEGWNGSHNGKACESGVYVYTIEHSVGKKKHWKDGNFTLLR